MHPWLYYGETLQIGTYPAVIVVGFCLCTLVLRREALFSGVVPRLVMDAALVGIVVGGICARLFHAVVEQPALYWDDPTWLVSPFGGWTFYGGFVGGLFGVWSVARWHQVSPMRVLDVFAVAIPFGQAIARLGCLAGGCCFGRIAVWPLGVEVPWSVTVDAHGELPAHLLAVPLHPAALYLSLMNLALFVGLSWVHHNKMRPGSTFALLLIGYGVGRGVVEVFRGDSARGLWFGGWLSSSQLVSVAVVSIGLWVWWRLRDLPA